MMSQIPAPIFAVYKPLGMSSHDVVNCVRRATGVARVGHAGTLDPLATGVLVIGVGREATRQLHNVVKAEKEYVAVVRLGMVSSTDDEEGSKKLIANPKQPTRDEVVDALRVFVGPMLQKPPALSAIKVKGQKAYALVRRGRPVDLPPRPVEVKTIELVDYQWPDVTVRLVTGPGFYVRAFARDLGERFSTGGYLAGLERTRVGQFLKKEAVSLDSFT